MPYVNESANINKNINGINFKFIISGKPNHILHIINFINADVNYVLNNIKDIEKEHGVDIKVIRGGNMKTIDKVILKKAYDELTEVEEKLSERQPELDVNGILAYKKDVVRIYRDLERERDPSNARMLLGKLKETIDKIKPLIDNEYDKQDYDSYVRLLVKAKTMVDRMR